MNADIVTYTCLGLILITGFIRLSLLAHWVGIFTCIMLFMIGLFKTNDIIFQIIAVFIGYMRYSDLCRLQDAYALIDIKQEGKDAEV